MYHSSASRSGPVRESEQGEINGEHFQSQPTWDTTVEVFTLVGHPKARRAYACMIYREGEQEGTVVALGLPPMASAQDAVNIAASRPRAQRVTLLHGHDAATYVDQLFIILAVSHGPT